MSSQEKTETAVESRDAEQTKVETQELSDTDLMAVSGGVPIRMPKQAR
ncbi:hypothetical protein [Kitasatospora cineracea]